MIEPEKGNRVWLLVSQGASFGLLLRRNKKDKMGKWGLLSIMGRKKHRSPEEQGFDTSVTSGSSVFSSAQLVFDEEADCKSTGSHPIPGPSAPFLLCILALLLVLGGNTATPNCAKGKKNLMR